MLRQRTRERIYILENNLFTSDNKQSSSQSICNLCIYIISLQHIFYLVEIHIYCCLMEGRSIFNSIFFSFPKFSHSTLSSSPCSPTWSSLFNESLIFRLWPSHLADHLQAVGRPGVGIVGAAGRPVATENRPRPPVARGPGPASLRGGQRRLAGEGFGGAQRFLVRGGCDGVQAGEIVVAGVVLE